MQQRPLGRYAAQLRLGALTLMAVTAMTAATTFTFRNGANGYTGATDVSINTQYAEYNGGNGVTWKNSSQLAAYTTTGSDSYAVRYLLKFGSLPIPAGSQVVSANLSLSFEWWGSGAGNLTGFYLKNAWDPAASNLGWAHRTSTADWSGPGASSAGVDTVSGKQFQVPALKPVGNQTLNMALDPAVVQSWIDSPSANQGILLVNNLAGDIVRINSTVASQNIRPMLTIVVSSVAPVNVTVAPSTATLQSGQTQQFTANVPVTWSATGGTITSAGLFTAGSTAGSFSVKATSTADPTKSATATVAIQTLTVAPTSATLQQGQTQQFTASVPVTWSATGGTITSAGLYTAGATPGSFSVKATSTADPTKSVTATVTIQTLTVAPMSATLLSGQTQQFTANLPVTWSATGGTITSTGLFTAGSTAGSFSVKATSTADPTKSVTATVTIQTLTVAPTSATLQSGQTQQFTANVPVTWSATGGTITSAGLFTAGSTPGSFSVKATSTADPTKSVTATVTIQTLTVAPMTATLLSGQTQQFTANLPVTWSATGGTITSAGLFTAGPTAGSFSVKATSTADPTKSVTATVTIQTLTVAPTSATLQSGQTQQFTASVPVTWSATGGTITSSGLFTAGSTAGSFSVKATSTADPTKSATATMTVVAASGVAREFDGAYIVVQSPVSGMRFTAPASIRIFADPFIVNSPDPDALTVNFLINGQSAGTFTGSSANNGLYPLTVNNLAAGTYTIAAQINTGSGLLTSAPVTVYVDNPTASTGPVFNLTADVVLSGAQAANYAGTATNRCTINGNGYQIRAASGFTGTFSIVNCNVRGLGTSAKPAIDVTANGSGAIQLIGNTFDASGAVNIAANDLAQAVVRSNEFRENTVVPVGSQPADVGTLTVPVFAARGNSSAQKFFRGNNVGLSTVWFENTRNWLIGGNTDAESNVLMGVRCGFTITGSTSMVLRGNYSQHNYPHRMSQAENFELQGNGFVVEHNVIRGSSWPVRGIGGEFRYNLVDAGGNSHAAIQSPLSNLKAHHNVFLYGVNQAYYGAQSSVSLLYNVDGVQLYNNTFDGGGPYMGFYGSPISVTSGAFLSSLRNNVFYNYAMLSGGPALIGDPSESTATPLLRLRYADYNAFYNPAAQNQTNYGLGVVGIAPGAAGYGMHDLGGFNGHMDPKFAQPAAFPFAFPADQIWTRAKKVSDVLAAYRARYSPASGSPLIGAGDPQDGPGGNIGAVGNNEASDLFGKFGTGPATPAPPTIGSFTASASTINAGQSVTLAWSVTGADTVSIAPIPGAVTGTSVSVTPASTTTFTLTATNSGGFATATVSVIVNGGVPISVTISPSSASVTPGGTKQFSANVPVTWTATGGTITSAGLYTAGSATGSFAVTATSTQDPTKSAAAAISIQTTQINVTVAPSTAILFPNAAQQFTASVPVTWTATGGTITSAGLYTAGAATGNFAVTATSTQDPTRSASASVSIVAQTSTSHPRILFDAPTLATLRARAQANTAEWAALKATCDSFVGGAVNFPDGNTYPNRPTVGAGYQGSGYYEAMMPLGVCYQTILNSDPTRAAQYGAKAVAILTAMSDPAHQVVDGTAVYDYDYGYGIRNYGTAMGLGYDWFYSLLSASQKSQLQTALNNWINAFEHSFEYDHPQGNYFAGYYMAKCMAALAVQGDNALADGWWNDWLNHQHFQRVQPYYYANMLGGGWTEGFSQYGIFASMNHALPALAVKTAKNIDLIHAAQPYPFPLDQGRYLMAFTWPTRDMMDDRGELYNTGDTAIWPGVPPLEIYRFFAGYLAMWNDPDAPRLHKYTRDVKSALDVLHAGGSSTWVDFLFWDPTAPEADYATMTPSYVAPGNGAVSARSDWSPAATFMTFFSAPYINNPAAGHEHFDKGSIAIERNKLPLLVNAPAWITHEPGGSAGWTVTFNDRFWDPDNTLGNRTLYNTFQVRHTNASGQNLSKFGQWAMQRSDGARTKVARHEDGGAYVLTVGQYLEDMYRPLGAICAGSSPVTQWTRQIVYLRPSQFVVYDRTGVCDASLDQYLAFHFPGNPVETTAPATGLRRFNVTAGQFAGAMTTVLPASPQIDVTDHFSSVTSTWNKMWRAEIRPTTTPAANRQWLTVFDLAPTAAQVANAAPIAVSSGAAAGTVLQSATGNSAVVMGTAPAGTPISGALVYTVPAAQTRHVVTDLVPSTGYTVSVAVSGTNRVITITQGGSTQSTANGVLTFVTQ